MAETCIRFGEHGARVMIEEKEIPHYAMHVDPVKKEVSCWIASEAGKAFSVIWLEHNANYPTSGDLYLDGHLARMFGRQSHSAKFTKFWRSRVSESSFAPFLFSKLVITDDDTYLDTPHHSIGEIKLVIDRLVTEPSKKIAKKRLTPDSKFAPPHLEIVHERFKKATAHRVGYGPAQFLRKEKVLCPEPVERLVTFIFKYRPLEMLQANEIVPRNPELLEPKGHALHTPATYEVSSGSGEHTKVKKEDAEFGPESDDSDEDSIMKEKALLAEIERIRKARERRLKDSERPKKKVKKEEKPFRVFTPGEIIDLT